MGGADKREMYVLVKLVKEFLEAIGLTDVDSLVSPIRCTEKWHPWCAWCSSLSSWFESA